MPLKETMDHSIYSNDLPRSPIRRGGEEGQGRAGLRGQPLPRDRVPELRRRLRLLGELNTQDTCHSVENICKDTDSSEAKTCDCHELVSFVFSIFFRASIHAHKSISDFLCCVCNSPFMCFTCLTFLQTPSIIKATATNIFHGGAPTRLGAEARAAPAPSAQVPPGRPGVEGRVETSKCKRLQSSPSGGE